MLSNLGIILAARGRYDEAIENYRQAIQINPNFPEALNNLGEALADKGRFDEAIKNYRQAIQINPNDYQALSNLGIALAARAGLMKRSRTITRPSRSIRIPPKR